MSRFSYTVTLKIDPADDCLNICLGHPINMFSVHISVNLNSAHLPALHTQQTCIDLFVRKSLNFTSDLELMGVFDMQRLY